VKAVILAAGYAVRLLPLTENFPKALLEVGGRTLLDHLVDQLATVEDLDELVLVSNARYYAHFASWCESHTGPPAVRLLNDGSDTPESRLGAVGDLRFAIDTAQLDDDLIVLAADNLLRFSLADFAAQLHKRRAVYVCARWNPDGADSNRRAHALFDDDHRLTRFVEKPASPISPWSVPPLYLYPRETLRWVRRYLESGGNPDAPGHLIEWLYTRHPVYVWKTKGSVLDVGDLQSLERARQEFAD